MARVELWGVTDNLEVEGALLAVEVTVPLPLKQYLEREGLPSHPVIQGFALIDTGAAVSAVDESVMAALSIPAVDAVQTLSPHGFGMSNVFNASVSFPQLGRSNVPLEHVLGCYVRSEVTGSGNDVLMLVGRDLMKEMIVTYDGPRGLVTVEV